MRENIRTLVFCTDFTSFDPYFKTAFRIFSRIDLTVGNTFCYIPQNVRGERLLDVSRFLRHHFAPIERTNIVFQNV